MEYLDFNNHDFKKNLETFSELLDEINTKVNYSLIKR